MYFKTPLTALALTVGLAQGAAATTINFTNSGTGAGGQVGAGPLSYSTSASATTLLIFPVAASVTVTGNGLGVNSIADGAPNQIGGFFAASETLTVTFSWAVNLIDFTLRRIDPNDDFQISFNGGAFTSFGPGLTGGSFTGLGQNNVTSFSIRASGGLGEGILGNDDFTLASANVATVPVPAAGLMLLAGLGGLAALRRRKAAV